MAPGLSITLLLLTITPPTPPLQMSSTKSTHSFYGLCLPPDRRARAPCPQDLAGSAAAPAQPSEFCGAALCWTGAGTSRQQLERGQGGAPESGESRTQYAPNPRLQDFSPTCTTLPLTWGLGESGHQRDTELLSKIDLRYTGFLVGQPDLHLIILPGFPSGRTGGQERDPTSRKIFPNT